MFADLLRQQRERAGWSQYELAKRSGLTKQTVSRLELGTNFPNWETVQRLVRALGVSYETFADQGIALPEWEPARPLGRPPKSAEPPGKRAKGKSGKPKRKGR